MSNNQTWMIERERKDPCSILSLIGTHFFTLNTHMPNTFFWETKMEGGGSEHSCPLIPEMIQTSYDDALGALGRDALRNDFHK